MISAYLAEIPVMVEGSANFDVFTHIDYAARYWPVGTAGRFDPSRFEDEFRTAMRAIAASGRALELNTRQLEEWIPRWWAESGAGRSPSAATPTCLPRWLMGSTMRTGWHGPTDSSLDGIIAIPGSAEHSPEPTRWDGTQIC